MGSFGLAHRSRGTLGYVTREHPHDSVVGVRRLCDHFPSSKPESGKTEMKQFSYTDESGRFDYERYKKVQIEGNKQKIGLQWVTEESVMYLSKYILREYGRPQFGICHGTRRGLEQQWFRKHLDCDDVIGTEISDTATQFPNTIQWDFHESRPEWLNATDFIYSNSWDHSYDPVKLFNAWMSCLKPGGLCFLEHTPNQTTVNELDPLGLTIEEMTALLNDLGKGRWTVKEILCDGPVVGLEGMKAKANHIVVQRVRPPALP